MKRCLICITGYVLFLLTGCSELQVIRQATMRELRAEVVSVDTLEQRKLPEQKDVLTVPELRPIKRTMVAKVEYNPFLAGARNMATVHRKGLWETGK